MVQNTQLNCKITNYTTVSLLCGKDFSSSEKSMVIQIMLRMFNMIIKGIVTDGYGRFVKVSQNTMNLLGCDSLLQNDFRIDHFPFKPWRPYSTLTSFFCCCCLRDSVFIGISPILNWWLQIKYTTYYKVHRILLF